MKRQSIRQLLVTLPSTALVAAGFVAGSSQATEQVCFSDFIPFQTTNWNSTVSVSKFDPELGILTSIYFELSGDVAGSAAIESLDASPITVNTTYQAEITLTRPDLSVLVVATPFTSFQDNLTAFDGTIDFAGTSGITHAGIQVNDTVSTTSPPPISDLALFTGAPGNPGMIVLPIDAAGTSTASGSGNLITQFLTEAGADVEVCYNYELDCNGNGIPDVTDISSGTSPDLDGDGIPDECQPSTTSFCEGDGSANGGADCPCNNNGNPGEGCDNGTGMGGLLIWTELDSVLIEFGQENDVRLRMAVSDITQRKHAEAEKRLLERQILHAQKLESLSLLTGGIAHSSTIC